MNAQIYCEVIEQLNQRDFGVMPFGGDQIKLQAIKTAMNNGDLHRMGFDVTFSNDYNRIKKHAI